LIIGKVKDQILTLAALGARFHFEAGSQIVVCLSLYTFSVGSLLYEGEQGEVKHSILTPSLARLC